MSELRRERQVYFAGAWTAPRSVRERVSRWRWLWHMLFG